MIFNNTANIDWDVPYLEFMACHNAGSADMTGVMQINK